MKLLSFLVPALVGVAAAHDDAEAYIFRSRPASNKGAAPSVSAPVAEAILQQRLSYGNQLSEGIDEEGAYHITQYGKTPQRLFTEPAADEPNQLVIVLRNMDKASMKAFQGVLPTQELSFTTSRFESLPSTYNPNKCSIEDAVNTDNKKCWVGKNLYLEYDAAKQPKAIKSISDNIPKLQSLSSNKLETTLVLAPVGSAPSNVARRDFFETEAVMNEESKIQSTSSSSKVSTDNNEGVSFKPLPFVAKTGSIPACFASKNACETATSECSGHGACLNKFAADADTACFACHCQKTHEGKSKSVWYWGGAACQKQDVSVPFWIFVGFTIFMVSAVGFSISLLFNIGEEKLPGVIGAGVSRGSK